MLWTVVAAASLPSAACVEAVNIGTTFQYDVDVGVLGFGGTASQYDVDVGSCCFGCRRRCPRLSSVRCVWGEWEWAACDIHRSACTFA